MTPNAVERLCRYAYLKLTRDLDARFESLLLTGRVSKWYSEVGNEATTVPAGLALEPGDALCSLHRDLGAILANYLDPARTFPGLGFETRAIAGGRDVRPEPREILYTLACQLLGKDPGFSRGVERSFHYGHLAPEQGILHVGMISHLGSMIPVAAGCAFALQKNGERRVAINFIGEGGTSTGDFHEGLNMAAVWKLPLVLVIENNRYAFSTPARLQYAAKQLADRGPGYGVASEVVDGNDPDAMADAYRRAFARARAGEGPTLLEAMLGRMRGHAEGDGSLRVVPDEEHARYLAEDPVPAYARRLEAEGVLSPELRERIDKRAHELVEEALSRGLDAPPPVAETARRSIFAAAPVAAATPVVPAAPVKDTSPTSGAGTGAPVPAGDAAEDSPTAMSAFTGGTVDKKAGEVTYLDGIHQALSEEMARDPRLILMGQDIGAFEGAFRVTRGLFARYPERVLDTPIAESGTIGIAIGAALLGYPTVIEMQFADFVSCGFNQIVNVAAKLHYRFEKPCPIVVRLPSGGGVGAGPFHSQNPEGWFAHTAGLKVVCPATALDAKLLMKAAIRDPNPVIFCEHKFLYRRIKDLMPQDSGDELEVLGRSKVVRQGRDLTLVGYGVSTWTSLEAATELEREGVSVEVVDLRTLVPFDEDTVLASAKKTGRVIVVHEAQGTGGFGAEVAARIADRAFAWLDAPVRRVTYPDFPVPYAKQLEQELMPTRDRLIAVARELLAF